MPVMASPASNSAQDEFNAMMSRNASGRLRSHPSNATPRSRSSSSGSTTLAASSRAPSTIRTTKTSSSITGRSAHRSRPSIASAVDRPRPVSSGSFYNDQSDSSDDDNNEPETPEDDGHDSSDSDGERAAAPKGPRKYYLPTQWDRGAMTGPKGVIADAAAFEREKLGKRSSDYHRTKDLKLPKAQHFGGSTSPRRRSPLRHDSRSGSNSSGMSEEDDRAVAAWREKRMLEMQQARQAKEAAGRKSSLGRGRDEIKVVDGPGFLDEIEKPGRGTNKVVVLITDDDNPISTTFSQSLFAISKKYPSHSFISLSCTDASIDEAACPAILAYKRGNQFAQIMPLKDEVPVTCNVTTTLEQCMRDKDILGSRFDIE